MNIIFYYLLMVMCFHFVFKYTDINECSENPPVCGNHSRCINTNGSYNCQCQHGFIQSSTKVAQCIGKCVWHAFLKSALIIVYSVFFQRLVTTTIMPATALTSLKISWEIQLQFVHLSVSSNSNEAAVKMNGGFLYVVSSVQVEWCCSKKSKIRLNGA